MTAEDLVLLLDDAEQACASVAQLVAVADKIVDDKQVIWALKKWETAVALAGDTANPPKGSVLDERCYKVLREIEALITAIDLVSGRRHCAKHPDGCPDVLQCTREQFEVADVVIRGEHLDRFTPGGKA